MKKIISMLICLSVCLSLIGCNQNSASKNEVKFSEKIKALQINDMLEFGNFEQDGDETNGKEPVNWIVLDKQQNKILVISEKVLDLRKYNSEEIKNTTWEVSTLREWLNSEFLDACFTKDEQIKIPSTFITGETSDKKTSHNPTYDKVFILSLLEAEQYFTSDDVKISALTQYAESKKSDYYFSASDDVGYYLRTLRVDSPYVAFSVNSKGKFGTTVTRTSFSVTYNTVMHNVELGYGVRPAIWIEAVD